MNKKFLLFILFSTLAHSQSTTVTATITDGDSNAWANGTYQIQFLPAPQNPNPNAYVWTGGVLTQSFSGSLNSSGALSVSIPSNSAITPTGSQWTFRVCPNATSGCFSLPMSITGASQSITTQLSAAAGQPRFSVVFLGWGYGTVEVTPTPNPGVIFYNVSSGASPTCNQWTGSTWAACGGSGTFNALTGDATSTSTGGATEVVGLLNHLLPSLATGYLNWTGSVWALSAPFTLTTTGSSGAATYTGGTLNIPQYSGGSMTWPSSAGYALYSGSNSWSTTHITDNGTTISASEPVAVTGAISSTAAITSGGTTAGVTVGTGGVDALVSGTNPTAVTGSSTLSVLVSNSTYGGFEQYLAATSSSLGTAYGVPALPLTFAANDLLALGGTANSPILADTGVKLGTLTNGDYCTYSSSAPASISCNSSGSGGGLNGTVTYTSSQTASSSDNGKLVIMNCSSSCAYTLPATQPSQTWVIWIQTTGSTNATIALGGSDTFNGSTNVPILNQYRAIPIWANSATSTDYRGDAPLVASTNVTLTPATNGLSISSSGSSGSLTGSGLTTGDVYYLNGSTLTLAEANASSTLPAVCVASSSTVCVYSGTITTGTWTAGGVLYVSDSTAGALTQTAPTTSGHYVQIVGIATSTSAILVMPTLNVAGIQ